MKIKPVTSMIIFSALLILYIYVGHDFVKFYSGGKAEIIEAGEYINKLCNSHGSCPTILDGWDESPINKRLLRGNMIYILNSDGETKDGEDGKKHQAFLLVYRFPIPDDWFEVQGGVGKNISSGWTGR